MTISLTSLELKGLKQGDGSYKFPTAVTMFIGKNGSGKTTILQAIHLLLRGRAPKSIGYASSGKDILALSNNGSIEITGTWTTRDSSAGTIGPSVTVRRTWQRARGAVREELEQSIDPSIHGTKEQQGLLNLYFGNIPETWNPDAFFDLSANKMRAKLLTSISSRPVRAVLPKLTSILGDDLPPWAKPSSMEMTVETWLQHAIKEADKRIRSEQSEGRICDRELNDEPEFVSFRKEEEVKAEMESLAELRKEASLAAEKHSHLSFLEGKRSALLDQISDIGIEVETTKAEIEEDKGRTASFEEIEEKYKKVAEEYRVIGAQAEIEEQRQDLRERVDLATKEEMLLKSIRKNLKRAEESLLEGAKAPFEEAISTAVGKDCTIDLAGGGCTIRVGGVDVSALSDGETLSLVPGIVAGLAKACEAKWLPLPLDRFESISKDRRLPFIRAVQKLIESGALSQAIIAGCPDTMPRLAGDNLTITKMEK